MTNPTGEINGFSEQTAWAAESLTGLATLSVHSFEHLVRHSYGVAGDAIEYAIAALQAGTTSREVTAYLAAQTTLTQAYLARQSQRQTQKYAARRLQHVVTRGRHRQERTPDWHPHRLKTLPADPCSAVTCQGPIGHFALREMPYQTR